MNHAGRRVRVAAVAFAALALGFAGAGVDRHLRAAGVLARASGEIGRVASYRAREVEVADVVVATPNGDAPARRYAPRGVASAPGVVVLHGVHRLAIDEPRLVRFARALASAGLVVTTPRLDALARQRVDRASVPTIAAAVRALRNDRLAVGRPVGVMGMSFAGGLALLAAAGDAPRGDIGWVLAMGAHDDLGRVGRFLATGELTRVDGSRGRATPHPYGATVLAAAYVDDLFAPADRELARRALDDVLAERHDAARAALPALSDEGRARLSALLDDRRDVFGPLLLSVLAAHEDDARAASPSGKLEGLRARVFLVHGAGDDVIPPSELGFLEREVPRDRLAAALVSPAISHVELSREPTWLDRFRVVHLVASLLDEAER